MATVASHQPPGLRRLPLPGAHFAAQLVRAPAAWHGLLVGCMLYVSMSIYAHHAYQGSWFGLLQPGIRFGVPQLEYSKGLRPFWEGGWDPMFYYYQSNDPFARGDAAEHIDTPPYRYQRIGVPLLAWASSRLLGYDITPPRLYHLIQILIVAIGFGVLSGWLREHGLSSLWAYGWVASTGVLLGLFAGMPDAVGDALFVMAIIAALRGRIWIYLPVATLLCLVRESYGVFAAAIFAISICGHVRWAGSGAIPGADSSSISRILQRLRPAWLSRLLCGTHGIRLWQAGLLAVPCLTLFGWQMYVKWRFGQTGSEALGHRILDWPFVAIWKQFQVAVQMQWLREVLLKQAGLAILLAGIAVAWRVSRRTAVAWPVLAYFAMLTLMSSIVWFQSAAYMKAMGSVLATLVIFLPWQGHWLLRCLLIAAAMFGPYDVYQRKKDEFLMPFDDFQCQAYDGDLHHIPPLNVPVMTGKLANFAWQIKAAEILETIWQGDGYHGVFSFAHRQGVRIPVTVTNLGEETWKHWPREGLNAIALSYLWIPPEGEWISGLRTPLMRAVAPGESLCQNVRIQLPPPGRYKLRIGLLQEGFSFFDHLGGGPMLELDVVIPASGGEIDSP